MSWEETSRNEHGCPCGGGTYTVAVFCDDWGRSEERWQMNCPACRERYGLHKYYYEDKAMSSEAYLWVRRELLREADDVRARLHKTRGEALTLGAARYIDKWLSYFHGAKTKKEVWRRLTDDGQRYPSLSAFYSRVRNHDVQGYLRSEFRFGNSPAILEALGIVDNEVTEKLEVAGEAERVLQETQQRMLREGFR